MGGATTSQAKKPPTEPPLRPDRTAARTDGRTHSHRISHLPARPHSASVLKRALRTTVARSPPSLPSSPRPILQNLRAFSNTLDKASWESYI